MKSGLVELRIDISAELAQQLDALAIAKNLKGRGEYVVPVLEAAVAQEIHSATLLLRMCRVNPLAPEPVSGGSGTQISS